MPEATEEWAIVELLGHVRTAGRISEVERFGVTMMRLDVPDDNDGFSLTQYIGGGSLYRVTLTTEGVARDVAAYNHRPPVHRYELPAATSQNFDDEPRGRDDD